MADLPGGTVTFLFTDIEGSTRMWDTFPAEMRNALDIHDEVLTHTVAQHGGSVVKNTGDGLFAAFPSAPEGVAAALDAQQQLANRDWPDVVGTLGVRMALHTATIEPVDGDYHGHDANLTARIEAAGHGGQILMSASTHSLLAGHLGDASTSDLGAHALRGISEPVRIFELRPVGVGRIFPPLRTASMIPMSLPRFTTSFVGRTTDITAVTELVSGHRLVTLLGPGGIGKTRLAAEVARAHADQSGTVAHFLGVASLTSADQIVKALGDSIGLVYDIHISAQLSEKTQLFDRLRSQPVLLVIDNLEHLEGASGLIGELVESAPSVTVLATSRRPLGISGEWKYVVPALADPVELFVERAQQAGAAVDRSDESLAAICDRLNGVPLAIELAATWAAMLPAAEILTEIDQSLDFLESDSPDVPERHRSVRAVFDHSWRLLGDDLRDRLAHLAVFAAPFDRPAAQVVAGASLRDLKTLVDRSLVSALSDGHYALHPLLREFATEHLGAGREAAWQRYADHYASLLEGTWPELRGSSSQMAARDRLAAELDHLRSVTAWWIAHEPEDRLLTLLMALNELHFQLSWADQKTHLEEVVAEYGRRYGAAGALERPSYRLASAWLAITDSSFTTPDVILERLDATRPRTEEGGGLPWFMWLVAKGVERSLRGDHEGSLAWYEQAASLNVELDPLSSVQLHAWRGWSQLNVGQIADATETFARGIEQATADEHELGLAFLYSKYGLAADAAGDHDAAADYHHQSREVFVKRGDLGGQGYVLSRLSRTHALKGEYELARRYALEGLEKFEEMNHRWGMAVSCGRAGFAEIELGLHDDAVGHFVECLDIAEESGLGDQLHYGVTGIARVAVDKASDNAEAKDLLRFEASAEANPYADHAVGGDDGPTTVSDVAEAVSRARRLAAKLA